MTKQTDGWRDFAKRWRTCAALIAASVLLILTQGVGFAQVAISATPATVNLVAGGTAAFSAIVTGSAVTITSNVGDTYTSRTWPARVVPSGFPTTMCVWTTGFP